MAETMLGDIISDHRERMLNLKKYYPFFKLLDTSFSQFREGRYESLDMGYISMAIFRFFIEENNFKEKDVTYPEYLGFMTELLRRDFGLELSEEENKEISDYIFDKIKNEGRPFEFSYFDPVDRKKYVSRMKIIESSIKDNTVWYSISADAIEFYLDTKEIKDESRINVSQLLLEKMIRSQNFSGGIEVVERINDEVARLQIKKNEVLTVLSSDVFAGIAAYEEFVTTGMRWFEDEERLFKKNSDLIAATLEKMESLKDSSEGFYRSLTEVYNLQTQLKVAMNRHSELLRACMDMQKMTDDAVKKAKLGRLRSHMDFSSAMANMIKTDNADILSAMLSPLFKLNTRQRFSLISIDHALTVKPEKYEKAEKIVKQKEEQIVFADEIEEKRIRDNYIFIMNNLINAIKIKKRLNLKTFNEAMAKAYGDKILKNADYYSFFVNLSAKERCIIGGEHMDSESFLDDYLKAEYQDTDRYGGEEIIFSIRKQLDEQLNISDNIMMQNMEFTLE